MRLRTRNTYYCTNLTESILNSLHQDEDVGGREKSWDDKEIVLTDRTKKKKRKENYLIQKYHINRRENIILSEYKNIILNQRKYHLNQIQKYHIIRWNCPIGTEKSIILTGISYYPIYHLIQIWSRNNNRDKEGEKKHHIIRIIVLSGYNLIRIRL